MSLIAKIALGVLVFVSTAISAAHQIQVVQGEACVPHIPMVSALRLDAFKEYPYLYVGTEETEMLFTAGYYGPQTLIGLAYDDEESQCAGILTGIPLSSLYENDLEIREGCVAAGLDISQYFYFCEVITIKKFRNRGIATDLFKELEKKVKSFGYKHVCFITSVREEDHPLKPEGYKGPESLFQRLGYIKTDTRISHFWPTRQIDGSVALVANVVALWVKEL